jgi:hypothetical protein
MVASDKDGRGREDYLEGDKLEDRRAPAASQTD